MNRDQVAGELIARILRREGGISTVVGETWETRWGQTPDWLDSFGLPVPKTMTEAEANYRTFLVRTRLIGVCDHADVFADALLDVAVHAGVSQAIKFLQRALHVTVDGVYGPETQAAVDAADRFALACRVIADRVRFNGRLIQQKPERSRYAAGWANREAELIEALAS